MQRILGKGCDRNPNTRSTGLGAVRTLIKMHPECQIRYRSQAGQRGSIIRPTMYPFRRLERCSRVAGQTMSGAGEGDGAGAVAGPGGDLGGIGAGGGPEGHGGMAEVVWA